MLVILAVQKLQLDLKGVAIGVGNARPWKYRDALLRLSKIEASPRARITAKSILSRGEQD